VGLDLSYQDPIGGVFCATFLRSVDFSQSHAGYGFTPLGIANINAYGGGFRLFVPAGIYRPRQAWPSKDFNVSLIRSDHTLISGLTLSPVRRLRHFVGCFLWKYKYFWYVDKRTAG